MDLLKAELEMMRNFIGDRKVLIADSSVVARSTIANCLTGLGARATNLVMATNFPEAEERLERLVPHLVLADYDLEGQCGLELLQKQRAQNPDSKESLFILVTGNTSQTAVARAAEEDVDAYVLKPFTPAGIKHAIVRAVLTKINPSDYMKTIERGKEFIATGSIDEAIAQFNLAVSMDPSPSLAYSYLGQSHMIKQALAEAQGKYLKGLEYNKLHYKCMVGLFEILMTQSRFTEAYEVVKRISQFFPANPQRLVAVLRLAIMTSHFEDIEKYHQIFTNIDTRNEDMTRAVCAALVVSGRHFMKASQRDKALQVFQKAATSSAQRPKILRDIVLAMAECGLVEDAEKTLKRFPASARETPEYHASEIAVADRLDPAGKVIERARQALSKNAHDPAIYKILIRRTAEVKLIDAAEDLTRKASARWPDQRLEFERALQGGAAASETKTAQSGG
jgi:CheY-like chemotaxis protein